MRRLSRPTARQLLVIVPTALPVLLLASFVVRGWHSADVPDYHAPDGAALDSGVDPTATAVASLAAVKLPSVDGSTTLPPPITTGTAHLSGTANAPDGFVPGATVRVERVLDRGDIQRLDVVTGADGRWDLPNIPGGRYRVRAFLAPALAQTDAQVFFLTDGEQRSLDLGLERFDTFAIGAGVAPDPPQLNQPVNLAIQVSVRQVDVDGVVHSTPTPGFTVSLAATGSWSLRGPAQAVTDGSGQATFELLCRAAGPNEVQVVTRGADPTKAPQQQTVPVPECIDPAATTTVPSSEPAPSGSTSTSAASTSTSAASTSTTAP